MTAALRLAQAALYVCAGLVLCLVGGLSGGLVIPGIVGFVVGALLMSGLIAAYLRSN